jgi:bisanhydrobacterioruberin hydratase
MKTKLLPYLDTAVFLVITIVGIVIYAAGYETIVRLTPLYLVMNIALLLRSYGWRQSRKIVITAGLVGSVAEMVGVQTGMLFGDYSYGTTLGPKLFGVPVMVSVLWALVMMVLLRCVPSSLGKWRPLSIAVLAVLYDVPLEHFATRYDLWNWVGSIPLSNAVGWFAVSYCIATICQSEQSNPRLIALATLPLHTFFFCALLLL